MKKVLALVLALVLVLSLVACGGSSVSNGSSGEQETESATTEATSNSISLNEKITSGDLEFSITEVEFVENFNPNGDYAKACSSGNVHCVVHTTFKNIGKTESRVPYGFLTLEYADGYTFEPEDTYHYSFDTNYYVANADELPIMGDAKPCQTYFEVPQKVETGTEALIIHVFLNDEEYDCKVR